MRVWERGAGETLACGTGACASVVAAVLTGNTERKVRMKLLGGELDIEWDEATNHVFMTGGAVTVFTGNGWAKALGGGGRTFWRMASPSPLQTSPHPLQRLSFFLLGRCGGGAWAAMFFVEFFSLFRRIPDGTDQR
ncbi:MAG: hypothetical protein ACLSAH_08005 [Bilophila wadsworthia]